MNTTVELPALHGRDPLGFLAAIGLHRLITGEVGSTVGLSFSNVSGCAILHSPLTSTSAIAAVLEKIVSRADDKTAIVGIDDRFPLAKPSRATSRNSDSPGESDPMRVPRTQFPDLVRRVAELGDDALAWLSVLVTDLAVDRQGRAALTPYCAPSGQQSLRTFFATPLQAVRREPHHLQEALDSWRRLDNFTGEYLDHRAIRDAGHHPRGKSVEAGVPGATWLATHALPALRLTGDGTRPAATLWHTHNQRPVIIWPLWRTPLNHQATKTLLQHPQLHPLPNPTLTINQTALTPLDVFDIAAAERQPIPGRKNAGVLTPLQINVQISD